MRSIALRMPGSSDSSESLRVLENLITPLQPPLYFLPACFEAACCIEAAAPARFVCDSATVTKLPSRRLTKLRIVNNFFFKLLCVVFRIIFSIKYLLPECKAKIREKKVQKE